MNFNLVPYTDETLISLYARYHEAVWPFQFVVIFAVAVVIYAILSNKQKLNITVWLMLAASWIFMGGYLFYFWFDELTWAASLFALGFGLQGVLLCFYGLLSKDLTPSKTGLFLIGLSILYSPLAIWFGPYDLMALPVAGLMPLPSAILTFGLLCYTSIRAGLLLGLIPFSWMLFHCLEIWELEFWVDFILMGAALIWLSNIIRQWISKGDVRAGNH